MFTRAHAPKHCIVYVSFFRALHDQPWVFVLGSI